MFNPVIETAIGLIFVYLLLSMICSALQEWIAALFALRASTLEQGIKNMLFGDPATVQKILSHPLIDGMSRQSIWDRILNRSSRPSYISAEMFSKAFLSAVNASDAKIAEWSTPRNPNPPPNLGQQPVNQPAQVSTANPPLHERTADLLRTFVTTTPGNIDTLRKNIEDWYNDSMDRVSGWYKRKTQLILLILGFLVTISFNADTLMLGRTLWRDPALRTATADAAAQWVKTHNQSGTASAPLPNTTPPVGSSDKTTAAKTKNDTTSPKPAAVADNYPSTTPGENAPVPPREAAYTAEQRNQESQDYQAAVEQSRNTLNDATQQLLALNLPLGWCRAPKESSDAMPKSNTADSNKNNDKENGTEESNAAEPESASTPCDPDHQFFPPYGTPLLLKLCGLFITTIALSQGAPFWFDLLKKVVNLRLTGESPNEKKK